MRRQWQRYIVSIGILTLLPGLISCAPGGNAADSIGNMPTNINAANSRATTNTSTSDPTDNNVSTISFTISGASAGTYTIHSTSTISKLRHGHKEFTIDLTNDGKSIFLAFYGYTGPGSYTLINSMNGGDVRVDLLQYPQADRKKEGFSAIPPPAPRVQSVYFGKPKTSNDFTPGSHSTTWDLSLQPDASCQLTITSDISSQYVGIDRMKGSFSCPSLAAISPDRQQKPIAVSNGQIDVLIIVES
jgi:hypothetical protein